MADINISYSQLLSGSQPAIMNEIDEKLSYIFLW